MHTARWSAKPNNLVPALVGRFHPTSWECAKRAIRHISEFYVVLPPWLAIVPSCNAYVHGESNPHSTLCRNQLASGTNCYLVAAVDWCRRDSFGRLSFYSQPYFVCCYILWKHLLIGTTRSNRSMANALEHLIFCFLLQQSEIGYVERYLEWASELYCTCTAHNVVQYWSKQAQHVCTRYCM